ncbi:hypothetical protein ZOSMA_121G00030 [Zostera marina]|uniref:50S ribosomal protein 5, chloroplastic n=1 Tax=Zostera marina TaxID=29655 RepID=A0A0K9Q305_ZOSMR|nr:hypothetical protein ZOSMA_121G00030 [Zostera marina]
MIYEDYESGVFLIQQNSEMSLISSFCFSSSSVTAMAAFRFAPPSFSSFDHFAKFHQKASILKKPISIIHFPNPGSISISDKRVWTTASDTGSSLNLPSESSSDPVSVENLPKESKLQERLEQKLKMKLAKKIRLRRKRLVQKRHLRKKGRWPPSKMKKNQNV